MISLDIYILDFVGNNMVAIAMFLGLLKGIARITKNVHDDKVVTLIELMFGQIPTPSSGSGRTTKR